MTDGDTVSNGLGESVTCEVTNTDIAPRLGSGDIERMIAEGEVYYIRPSQDARGDRAVYDVSADSVTFTGNVIIMSDENVIRGNTLVLQIGSRRTTIRPQAGQRVRGVFVPSESAQTPANRPQ
jgi:lipopolysaccharide export system protein LptA